MLEPTYKDLENRVKGLEKAEEKLRVSEEKYRSLVDINPGVIYRLDSKGTIIFINSRISEIIGFESDELFGKNISEIICKDDFDKIKYINERRTGKRATRSLELRLIGKEGKKPVKLRYVEINANGIYENGYTGEGKADSRGKATVFIGTQGTITDITEHNKAEEALKKKTKELSTILTNMDQGIAYLDENNIIIYLNHQCADLLKLKYEDVSGKNIYDFHLTENRKKIDSLISEIRNGEKTKKFVWQISDKFIDISFHRIEDADQNYQGILLNAVDVTECKILETQFIQAQKMESVGQLAGGVAHDFNNILTVILGNAELALMSLPREDQIFEIIMEIKNSADRAANLTRQLLAFSRRQIIEPQIIILNKINRLSS